jgi:hypothetical protein
MRCENCGRQDLWVVHFETVGTTTFAYCRHCEHRRWESAGSNVDVETILGSVASIEPAKPRR